jgi:hypothetical protein
MNALSTSYFVLSAMVGKIEQHVCIKFCMKLGKSVTGALEMLCEALGEHFFKPDSGFSMAFMFQGQSSVSWR